MIDFEALKRYVGERPGQKLPGEREMAALFGVSRPRLRKLLDGLERDGWVERRQGSGTYAASRTENSAPQSVLLLIDAGLRLNDDPFFSLAVERLQATLQAAGARCVVRRQGAGEPLPRLREDGVLTLGLDSGARLLTEHGRGGPPAVVLLTPDTPLPPGAAVSLIQCDNRGAGQQAARRLLDLGLGEAWFVGHDSLPASRERREGAERAGLRLRCLEAPGLNFAGGQQAARTLPLPAADGPVGIIAANDWLAVGLRTGLTARGVSPALSPLVSFDGLEIAAAPEMGIASLAAPLEALAEDAVAELRRLGRTPAPPGRVLRYAFAWHSPPSPLSPGTAPRHPA